jgi:signal recognition particle subunit SRP54
MFDRLTDSFNGLFRKLSGKDAISESNVQDAMSDVRTALLDADVHLDVVNSFSDQVLKDAIGQKVVQSLEPGQQMISIVHKRLVELLGGQVQETKDEFTGLPIPLPKQINPDALIQRAAPPPTIVMMCGLQGSGKTTTCGKLAAYLKKRGRSVMLAACDLQRPAAVEQLRTIAEQVKSDTSGGSPVHFYAEPDKCAEYGKAVGVAVQVAQRALASARQAGVDTLIIDTAGRLHINEELMGELGSVKRSLAPHHVFLVVDAMTGQDAVNSAKAFHERLTVDGVILSKYDSDTRGGAALSVRHVTGAPIKFVGTGEKLDAIEEFHADRVAGRILGMGDIVSLVEKAQQEVDEEEVKTVQQRMEKGELTMDDFLKQMKTLRRMGPMKQLLGLLPGVGSMIKDVNIDDKQLDKVEAMISSMTMEERSQPHVINNSRKKRISHGSATKQEEVGQLVRQFEMVGKVTRQLAGMNKQDRAATMAAMNPGVPGMRLPGMGRGSTHTASVKDKFKKRKR